MEEKIQLHLGCGYKKIYGFINVDIRTEVKPDLVEDAFELKSVKNNSVDLIYTCHMLEHIGRKDAWHALFRYYQVLKEDGELYISVPDLERVFEHYIFFKDLRKLQGFIYGGQDYKENYHLNGWDFKTLELDLYNAGFNSVERFDRWEIDWLKATDDYSAAYLEPEFDRKKGHAMSLNVMARK